MEDFTYFFYTNRLIIKKVNNVIAPDLFYCRGLAGFV